jgi:hypothetical protein
MVLRVNEGRMEIVDNGGRHIVKPPHLIYAELPETRRSRLNAQIVDAAVGHNLAHSVRKPEFVQLFRSPRAAVRVLVDDTAQRLAIRIACSQAPLKRRSDWLLGRDLVHASLQHAGNSAMSTRSFA